MRSTTTAFTVPPEALVRMAATRTTAGDRELLRAGLYSRRLVLLKSLLTRLSRLPLPPGDREAAAGHWRLLAQAGRHAPDAVRSALEHPAVGGMLAEVLSAPAEAAAEEVPDRLGAIAVCAALHARTGFRTTLRAPGGVLVLPGLGAYRARAAGVRIAAGARGLRLTPEGRRTGVALAPPYDRARGAGWYGLCPLPGGRARLDDLGLDRTAAAAAGLPVLRVCPPPPSRPVRPWLARWRAALALLGSADPARAGETALQLRALVPLSRTDTGVRSATVRAAPWAVFTVLPETAARMAEVLVHELQHSKLAVLSDLVPFHEPGGGAVHRVPWRADPRPLGGVLQGTFAHLALTDLWHRLAERPGASPGARAAARSRCENYRAQTAEALPILLESGQLTAPGREFAIGMAQHLAALGRHGAVPPQSRQMLSRRRHLR
ncbi:HEXXH motif-containing putative peptide modification protein [Streptomyces sp. TRM 70361]|uniref:aKG-HExxH-type peptide beta-hydroxylase n=1 Tax=Streptomyces sp. TRM 70361 TaxID=3116553 RepID=UPI002E7BC792|nr:HEXXH motif-containing putative peptide modification protein [Streptomyces sp. TRM 70361]MEE1938811.1 HEXXH motif-containing putative peptide modification protein [Streptomyces sp. TRM 70361]